MPSRKIAATSPPFATAAVRHLKKIDPVLGAIIAKVGPLRFQLRPERFHALARAIIFQQLAGAAANAIYNRIVEHIGDGRFPTPEQILAAPEEQLRAAGLSRGKIVYLRDLALHVRDGLLSFARFPHMDDEEVITDLIRVKGIGRWTAEMFLMFNLGRPDVLPVDDLGFRNAMAKAYGLPAPLPPKELRVFGERWRPYRTAAVWYLWQSLNLVTAGDTDHKAKPRSKTVQPMKKPTRA